MTKKKSAVIKNYILEPESVVIKYSPVTNPNFINKTEKAAKILKSIINKIYF